MVNLPRPAPAAAAAPLPLGLYPLPAPPRGGLVGLKPLPAPAAPPLRGLAKGSIPNVEASLTFSKYNCSKCSVTPFSF